MRGMGAAALLASVGLFVSQANAYGDDRILTLERKVHELEVRLRTCELAGGLPRSVLPWDDSFPLSEKFPWRPWHDRLRCSAVGLGGSEVQRRKNSSRGPIPEQSGGNAMAEAPPIPTVYSDYDTLKSVVIGRADGFRFASVMAEPLLADDDAFDDKVIDHPRHPHLENHTGVPLKHLGMEYPPTIIASAV